MEEKRKELDKERKKKKTYRGNKRIDPINIWHDKAIAQKKGSINLTKYSRFRLVGIFTLWRSMKDLKPHQRLGVPQYDCGFITK